MKKDEAIGNKSGYGRKPVDIPIAGGYHVNYRATEALPGVVYTAEELEWLRAVDAYRRNRRRNFPTACEYLALLKSLGYAKRSEGQR